MFSGRIGDTPFRNIVCEAAGVSEPLRIRQISLAPPEVLFGALASGDFGAEALRQLALTAREGRDQGADRDEDRKDRDQERKQRRREGHAVGRGVRKRKEDRGLHRRVMHARDGAAHDRGGDDGCRHRRRLQTMGVETDVLG